MYHIVHLVKYTFALDLFAFTLFCILNTDSRHLNSSVLSVFTQTWEIQAWITAKKGINFKNKVLLSQMPQAEFNISAARTLLYKIMLYAYSLFFLVRLKIICSMNQWCAFKIEWLFFVLTWPHPPLPYLNTDTLVSHLCTFVGEVCILFHSSPTFHMHMPLISTVVWNLL